MGFVVAAAVLGAMATDPRLLRLAAAFGLLSTGLVGMLAARNAAARQFAHASMPTDRIFENLAELRSRLTLLQAEVAALHAQLPALRGDLAALRQADAAARRAEATVLQAAAALRPPASSAPSSDG
jgi:uncharacterized protein YlxW (UPF0749 family)